MGGMEAPGAREVARIPSVIVPVCVVKGVRATLCVDETPSTSETPCVKETACGIGVVASVPECVLPSMPCVKGAPRVYEAACARETACVCESRCVSGTTFAPETARVCEPPCMSGTPRVSAPACVSGMVCVEETARVSERLSVRETACVRSLYVREMKVGMREHAAASPGVSVMVRCLSLVTRRCAWVEWRRRRRQTRDKGRVAAVVVMGTVPGWHSSERAVRSMQRTRPPRARLRE